MPPMILFDATRADDSVQSTALLKTEVVEPLSDVLRFCAETFLLLI